MTFPLRLDERQERRATELHRKSIVIDLLCQGPLGSGDFTEEMSAQIKTRWEATHDLVALLLDGMNLPAQLGARRRLDPVRRSWLESGVTAGNRQVELANLDLFAATFGVAQQQFDAFDWLIKALTGDDFRRAKEEGNAAGFTRPNSRSAPPRSTYPRSWLRARASDGATHLQLHDDDRVGCTERTDAGVSNFGASVVKRLNELGVIVDVSYCGRQTTLDACELSDQPVVASHSSAQSMFAHDRAKSDDEIKALAETGGLIGIYVVPPLAADPKTADLNTGLDHGTCVIGPRRAGVRGDRHRLADAVAGMGCLSPADGTDRASARSTGWDTTTVLGGFSHYREFSNFARALVSRGFSDQEIEGILGSNFLRVFEKVFG